MRNKTEILVRILQHMSLFDPIDDTSTRGTGGTNLARTSFNRSGAQLCVRAI